MHLLSNFLCCLSFRIPTVLTSSFCTPYPQVLPIAIRNVLDENVRSAIIQMCRVFQKLCEKEIRHSEQDDMMHNVIMATCGLEKEFPSMFLNVMTHLLVHLVQQLFICGPVHCRWMYPIERYMKTLKDYICTYVRTSRGKHSWRVSHGRHLGVLHGIHEAI